ncbi:MAG: hypothetical protein GAK45_00560 [Pseudomonas citronellolis]|nr:MAG: hypothetical protein GAK45_00560 [Pseudomonas citronellolis]
MNSLASPYLGVPLQPLCDERGRLAPAAIGWSVRPRVLCGLPGNFGRRKRWNHWCLVTPDWMLTLTVADLDYLAYGAVCFLDLRNGRSLSRSRIGLPGRNCELPDQPNQSHAFHHEHLTLKIDDAPGGILITARASDLGELPLDLALEVQRPAHLESVNLVVPMGGRHFHACSRQMGLPMTGSLQLGDERYDCQSGHSFAALDFGRGVWPLHSHWTRAAFAAPGGIAGNFGSGWTDRSSLKENALWFGGELHALGGEIDIRQSAADPLAPWHLRSACASVDLRFIPRQQHRAHPRFGPFGADTRQWFGEYHGHLRSPQGERVPVDGAHGWIGSTRARW